MENARKVVGENLKHICKSKGIRNYQVAEYLGVTEGSVSHWFRGDNSIDIDNLHKLCKWLNVSMNQVFGVDPIVSEILSQDELELLTAYRNLNKDEKRVIRRALNIEK